MCKLLGITNLDKIEVTQDLVVKLARVIGQSQPDGLGFVITNNKGNIYHRGYKTDVSINAIEYKNSSNKVNTYTNTRSNIHKLQSKGNNSLILHSRTSTNEINLGATHPFNFKNKDNKNVYFIHNGVVEIESNDYKLKSKNDSEFLAHYYNDQKDLALKNFCGYAAIMQLVDDQMVIFRDDMADLYTSSCDKLNTTLFTTKYDDALKITKLLSKHCRIKNNEWTHPQLVEDNLKIIFGKNNELINQYAIDRPYYNSYYGANYMQQSLGKSSKDDSDVNDSVYKYHHEDIIERISQFHDPKDGMYLAICAHCIKEFITKGYAYDKQYTCPYCSKENMVSGYDGDDISKMISDDPFDRGYEDGINGHRYNINETDDDYYQGYSEGISDRELEVEEFTKKKNKAS